MVHLPVTLPNGVAADLYYMHDYGSGGAFDYIQRAGTNSIFMVSDPLKFEEKYSARSGEELRGRAHRDLKCRCTHPNAPIRVGCGSAVGERREGWP